jgi:hypothetical protein
MLGDERAVTVQPERMCGICAQQCLTIKRLDDVFCVVTCDVCVQEQWSAMKESADVYRELTSLARQEQSWILQRVGGPPDHSPPSALNS